MRSSDALLLLICCAVNNLFACVNGVNISERRQLEVEVFYEALCPDSIRFVRNQLHTAMKSYELLPYTELKFVPYGKATVWTDHDKNLTHLYCQHGERECELNALHACIVENNPIEEQLEMINCLLTDFDSDVDICSKNLGIDVNAAKRCKSTRSTSDILKKYGDRTNAIEISFVPSITMDSVFDAAQQHQILYNFTSEFCSKYKAKFDVAPPKCEIAKLK